MYITRSALCFFSSPWDIQKFLRLQCEWCGLPVPAYARSYVDMRRHFGNCYNVDHSGDLSIVGMLHAMELDFEGREHSGIDDSRNIGRIMEQMVKDGWILKNNRTIL